MDKKVIPKWTFSFDRENNFLQDTILTKENSFHY
jgi:hypothetical protein